MQAWHLAGLSCLLLDEEAAARVRSGGAAPAPRPSARPANNPADNPAARPAPNSSGAPAEPLAASAPARPRPTAPAPVSAPPAQSQSLARPAASAAPEPSLADWPRPWRDLMGRSKPAPLAWTYPELGADLLLSGNKQRSAALREMISRLRLPRGSSVFWPPQLPEELRAAQVDQAGQAGANIDYFRAGLNLLEVRCLIAFGPKALRGTSYEALPLKPFSEQLCDGRIVFSLPDFASLLALPNRLDKVVLFLNSVLSRFLRA